MDQITEVTVKCEPVDDEDMQDLTRRDEMLETKPDMHDPLSTFPNCSENENLLVNGFSNNEDILISEESQDNSQSVDEEGIENIGDPVKCPACDKTFKTEPNMNRHYKLVHTDNEVKCDRCDKVFKSIAACNAHSKTHVEKIYVEGEAFACNLCGKGFANGKKLSNHKFYAHSKPDESVTCTLCNKVFAKKYKLRVHLRNVHTEGKMVGCDQCDKVYKNNMLLRRHILWSHPQEGKVYECEDCDKEFTEFSLYKKHLWHVHDTSREMTCEICKTTLASKKSWKRHMRSVHKDGQPAVRKMKVGTLPCSYCDKKFTTNTGMYWHVEQNHSEYYQPTKTCPICAKEFNEYYLLRRHLEMVHPIEPATCDVCSKTFKSEANLEDHKRVTHAPPEAAKPCEICKKTFKCGKHLRIHMNTVHPKDGSLTCSVCKCDFPSRTVLNLHKKVHLKIRIFDCEFCEKNFRRQYDLTRHVDKVHKKTKEKKRKLKKEDEQPVSRCLKCDKCFDSDKDLHEHIISCDKTSVDLSIVKIEIQAMNESSEENE